MKYQTIMIVYIFCKYYMCTWEPPSIYNIYAILSILAILRMFVLKQQQLTSVTINKVTTEVILHYISRRVSRQRSIRDRKSELLLLLFLVLHLPVIIVCSDWKKKENLFCRDCDVFAVIRDFILNRCRCSRRLLNDQAYYQFIIALVILG